MTATAPAAGAHMSASQNQQVFVAPSLPSRIPSLDGIRGVSIGLVMIGHSALTAAAPRWMHPFEHFGNLGVRSFFVISGFLITTLLLKEKQRTGKISLRSFYIRRGLRILPASLVFMSVIALLAYFGYIRLYSGDSWHAFTYTMNYQQVRSWWYDHLWSLSVEEQFYLVWPGLLCLCGVAGGVRSAWLVIVFTPVVRAFMYFALAAHDSAMTKHFEACADSLAMGCLLSAYYDRLTASSRYLAFHSSRWFWPATVGLVAGGNFMFVASRPLFYVVGQTCVNFGILLCIDHWVRLPQRGVAPLLNTRPLVFIGTLSYSLYLWQNPFLNPLSLAWPCRFPFNFILLSAAALFSYYIVEKPFLGLKDLTSTRKAVLPETLANLPSRSEQTVDKPGVLV
jgi:peptidoglycan/LPS O-acetylase OafA/YrhL